MKSFGSLFWNPQEGRLRALVRIFIYLGLWRALSVLLDSLLIAPLADFYRSLITAPVPWLERAMHFLIYLVVTLLVTWFAARWIDRRPLTDLGLGFSRRWWVELVVGLVLGLLLMSVVFAVLWLAGWVQVTRYFAVNLPTLPFAVALLGPLLAFTVISIVEETVFRGYFLRNAAEGLRGTLGGSVAAVVSAWLLTSLLFSFFHVFNPNSTWVSTTNLAVAGFLFGLPVVLTGRLGLAIGLHITWNFAQGTLFGFRVSGNEFSGVTLIQTRTTGPVWWTGGDFGPEAGLLGLFAMSLGCLLILAWLWLRDRRVRIQPALALPASSPSISTDTLYPATTKEHPS